MKGCVYLIGAGCGAMDLITVRGLRLLQSCDAVVYDDLIDPALLDLVPDTAERIYVGKRLGRHSASQEKISGVLAHLAAQGKRVARLKGGDPYVFGRGGEEALAMAQAGIPCQMVPGISSAIAIPALAGIPVTHRGLSRSFHVITGHTADRENGLPEHLEELARLEGTLVFLMGLNHLEELAAGLMEGGLSGGTPAAVISGGNAEYPAAVRADLAHLAEATRRAGVKAPAVIVVGATAGMDLAGAGARPLTGVRVGLTGTDSMAQKLRAALEEQGALVSTVERSVVEKLPLKYDLTRLGDGAVHWLVFTSANGVRIFFEHWKQQRLDLRSLARCKFAVIGSSTGALLEEYGFRPDLCPGTYTSRELGRVLSLAVEEGQDVVLLRARQGAPILPELLREREIPVTEVPLYDLSADHRITERSRSVLPDLDYLTFSSGGGVELYWKEHKQVPEQTVCVCIGEVTARALAARYDRPFLTADTISAQGMVRSILDREQEKSE